MGFDLSWLSQAGKKTGDNRDCAGIGIRAEEALCVVLDGSTTGPNSGEFARQTTQKLIDWYVDSKEEMNAEILIAHLRHIHERLAKTYPRDSASYMIVNIQRSGAALVLHAGDCLLGRRKTKDGIEWLSQPHTLASAAGNTSIAAIVDLSARHLLTRSFRAKEFLLPAVMSMKVDGEIVVATDGFWAELSSSDQNRFIDGHGIPMVAEGDDRSVLRIRFLDGTQDCEVRAQNEPGNLFERTSGARRPARRQSCPEGLDMTPHY